MSSDSTRIDAGPGDDVITAIVTRGSTRVACGAGNDTVNVSRFKGNRKHTTVGRTASGS